MTDFSKQLSSKVAEKARKIIDYYDGKQYEYMIKQLSDVNSGRRDWRARGLIPRTRNLVKMIIGKSGLITTDKLPNIEIHSNDLLNETETQLLNELLIAADYEDTVRNIDPIIRALSTARILVQWDDINKKFVFDILGLHNSATILDQYKNLVTLIYRTSCEHDGSATFRVFTPELIQDIEVDKDGTEVIRNSVPNPYGFIPLAAFHDTAKPRTGDYNEPPEDIVQLNEIVNLHLTDSEYALKFMKYGTWVTNCNIEGQTSSTPQVTQVYNRNLPVQTNTPGQEVIIGPTQVVKVSTVGIDNPMFEWKTPIVDLQPLDTIVNTWVHDFAADWSVNIKAAGQATATSGFQLVVEEIDNLELKKVRSKQFACGLEQVCMIMMKIANMVGYNFSEDSKPNVVFSTPILPVAELEDEQVWSLRLREGRASRTEYFITKFDMTLEQAQEKIAQIDSERQAQQVSTLSQMNVVPNAPNVQKFMVGA